MSGFIINSTHVFFSKEDKVPTIHFWEDIMAFKCPFRIDKAEWVNNLEDEKPLTDVLDLEFILDYFNEKDSEFPELSRFELARRIWNINHIDNEVPKIEMPDYKQISSKGYN